jgi:hypothetical protein
MVISSRQHIEKEAAPQGAGAAIPEPARPARVLAAELESPIIRIAPEPAMKAAGGLLDGPVLAIGRARVPLTDWFESHGVDGRDSVNPCSSVVSPERPLRCCLANCRDSDVLCVAARKRTICSRARWWRLFTAGTLRRSFCAISQRLRSSKPGRSIPRNAIQLAQRCNDRFARADLLQ